MHLWLSKNSAVPIREQLMTQIMLGVTSGDLKPGTRLPSTRELARRFRVHANTVSAAYRELTERGWIELRPGSGVYVRGLAPEPTPPGSRLALDRLIADFLRSARAEGFALEQIKRRVADWLELHPPDHFLVIEPDADLRLILETEIHAATHFPVRGTSPTALAESTAAEAVLTGAVPIAMYGQADRVRALLPVGTTLLLLHTRSVPESLRNEQRPPADALITVASGWREFLRYTRNVLLAAGLDHDALDFRDTHEQGWQRGLRASHFVITDALTAHAIPADVPKRVFHLIADSSVAELTSFVAEFLTPSTSDDD